MPLSSESNLSINKAMKREKKVKKEIAMKGKAGAKGSPC